MSETIDPKYVSLVYEECSSWYHYYKTVIKIDKGMTRSQLIAILKEWESITILVTQELNKLDPKFDYLTIEKLSTNNDHKEELVSKLNNFNGIYFPIYSTDIPCGNLSIESFLDILLKLPSYQRFNGFYLETKYQIDKDELFHLFDD